MLATRSGAWSLHEETRGAITRLNERLGVQVDEEVVESAARACHMISLPKKRTLFHRGETPHYFYRVLSGCVQLHVTPSAGEDRKVLAFLREGESVCHEAALLDEAYPVSAESVCDSRILACPRTFVHELLRNKPEVAVNMLRSLSRQTLTVTRRLGDLMGKSGVRRAARFLMEHAPGLPSKSFEVTLPASKQCVASHLQISQETLSRIFADLKAAGLITVRGRVVTVLDSEGLRRVAAGVPSAQISGFHLAPARA